MATNKNASVVVGPTDSGIAQSALLDLLDGVQLSQPVRHCLALVLVSRVPPSDIQRVTGAYDEACIIIRWVELQPSSPHVAHHDSGSDLERL